MYQSIFKKILNDPRIKNKLKAFNLFLDFLMTGKLDIYKKYHFDQLFDLSLKPDDLKEMVSEYSKYDPDDVIYTIEKLTR